MQLQVDSNTDQMKEQIRGHVRNQKCQVKGSKEANKLIQPLRYHANKFSLEAACHHQVLFNSHSAYLHSGE